MLLSIGTVLLVAAFVVAGVFYFKLKNVSENNSIVVEEKIKKVNTFKPTGDDWAKDDLRIKWNGTSTPLSAEENHAILSTLFPKYDSIIEKFNSIKKTCPGDNNLGSGAVYQCGFLSTEKPEIKLFSVGEVEKYSLPVYYVVKPIFYIDGPSPSYASFLVVYEKDNNRLTMIVTDKSDTYAYSNANYGFFDYPEMKEEEQKQFSFNLSSEIINNELSELLPPLKIPLPNKETGAYLKFIGERYKGISAWHNIGGIGDFGTAVSEFDKQNESKFKNQKIAFVDPTVGNVYFNGECYFYITPVGSVFIYDLQPSFIIPLTPVEAEKEFFSGVYSLDVIWPKGIKETDHFINGRAVGGCGDFLSGCPGIVEDTKSFTNDNLVEVAKTKQGDSIYELKNRFNSQLYWDLYLSSGQVVDGVYNLKGLPSQQQLSEINALESYNKFINDRPILFWKDFAGNWRRLQKTKYQPQAECGKPVIYLYPEKDTDVKVKVKPNGGFTKTDPAYNTGWFVRATPQSDLFNYADKTNYPYLFWEGHAYGFSSPDNGFVMSKAEVGTKMTQILGKLGLNEKETKDFLEFWQPKLEAKPYVFVTFVSQREFDKAAPLSVSPKPDTVIRVFMDYTLLDAPIKVAPMQIRTPERKGFTVVEWGGRLH